MQEKRKIEYMQGALIFSCEKCNGDICVNASKPEFSPNMLFNFNCKLCWNCTNKLYQNGCDLKEKDFWLKACKHVKKEK